MKEWYNETIIQSEKEEWICQVPEDITAAVPVWEEWAAWATDLLPLPGMTGDGAAEWDVPRAAAAAAVCCLSWRLL